MSEASRVVVTITPAGAVHDVTVDGHSIANAVRVSDAELTLQGDLLPQLVLVLVPDEITIKGEEHDRLVGGTKHVVAVRVGAQKILDEYDNPPEGGSLVPRLWVEENRELLKRQAAL